MRSLLLDSLSQSAGALVLVALLLAGCVTSRKPATSQYHAARNETVYRIRPINLGTIFEGSGLGSDPRVSLRSWATCSGQDCRPSAAWISFSLQRTSKQMQITSDRSVTIKTDGNVYTWEQKNVTGSRAPTSGEVARVELDLSALQDVATTKVLNGSIGGSEFSLSREERKPLRALHSMITGSDANNSAEK